MYVINSDDQNEHIRVSVSFSSMYKAYDVSNVHVKSLYHQSQSHQYIQSYKKSRGTVKHPSSNTFLFG